MELGKAIEYNIKIEPSANKGFIVRIGCGVFIFTSIKELLTDMENYLRNPSKMEAEYNKVFGSEELNRRDRSRAATVDQSAASSLNTSE